MKIFALLGCYAALSYRRSDTNYRCHCQGSSSLGQFGFEDGIPEERSSHLHSGGSLKSRTVGMKLVTALTSRFTRDQMLMYFYKARHATRNKIMRSL